MPQSRSRSRSRKRSRRKDPSQSASPSPPRKRAKRDDKSQSASRSPPRPEKKTDARRRSRWGSRSDSSSSEKEGKRRDSSLKEQIRKAKARADSGSRKKANKKKRRKNWEDSQSETESSSSSDSEPPEKTKEELKKEAKKKAEELAEERVKKKKMKLIFNYYEVLDLPDFSTAKKVKKAYRQKSQVYHPDKNLDRQEQAERRFHRITEAFDCLKDPDRKKSYDGRLLCELKRKARYDKRHNRFGIDLPPSPPPPDFEYYNWDPTITRKRRKAKPASPLGSPCSAEEKMRDIPRAARRRKKRRFQTIPQGKNYNEAFNFQRIREQRMKREGFRSGIAVDLDFMD